MGASGQRRAEGNSHGVGEGGTKQRQEQGKGGLVLGKDGLSRNRGHQISSGTGADRSLPALGTGWGERAELGRGRAGRWAGPRRVMAVRCGH